MKLSAQEMKHMLAFGEALGIAWTEQGLRETPSSDVLAAVAAQLDDPLTSEQGRLIRDLKLERGVMLLNRAHIELGRSGYAIDPGQLPEQ